MGFFGEMFEGFNPLDMGESQRSYEAVYQTPHHQASLTHEVIAAAAGFAAMHAYEAHLRATGQPVSHGKMKEFLAAIAAAEVDKLAETKGLDYLDRRRARKMAEQQAHHLAEQRYGEGSAGWDYVQSAPGPRGFYDFDGREPYSVQGYGGGGGGYGYGGGPPQQPPQGYEYGGPPQGGYGAPAGYGAPGYGEYPEQRAGYQQEYYPPPQQQQGYGGGYGGYQPPPPQGPPPGGYYEGGYGGGQQGYY